MAIHRSRGFLGINNLAPVLFFLLLIHGCAEKVVEIPMHKDGVKNISTVAILTPVARPDISIDTVSDDRLLLMLFSGPAILPQLLMQVAMIDAQREDTKRFNALTYDTHVGRMLRESLYRKLKRQAPFHIVPPDVVDDDTGVYALQDKKEKTKDDYESIARRLGADTIIELDVLSCGIKDPGVFSKPHTLLIAKVTMIRARGKEILWQTKVGQAIPQDQKFGFDYEKYEAEEAQLLKDELDTVASMLSEQIIEAMGFKAQLPTARLLEPAGRQGILQAPARERVK
ncbi:MAG: hypothetical protein GY800_10250 [Planctomycetes bacterium]|nr:hypothetical protein [Planctomycetota bacterium]